jgi:hypothetical protein
MDEDDDFSMPQGLQDVADAKQAAAEAKKTAPKAPKAPKAPARKVSAPKAPAAKKVADKEPKEPKVAVQMFVIDPSKKSIADYSLDDLWPLIDSKSEATQKTHENKLVKWWAALAEHYGVVLDFSVVDSASRKFSPEAFRREFDADARQHIIKKDRWAKLYRTGYHDFADEHHTAVAKKVDRTRADIIADILKANPDIQKKEDARLKEWGDACKKAWDAADDDTKFRFNKSFASFVNHHAIRNKFSLEPLESRMIAKMVDAGKLQRKELAIKKKIDEMWAKLSAAEKAKYEANYPQHKKAITTDKIEFEDGEIPEDDDDNQSDEAAEIKKKTKNPNRKLTMAVWEAAHREYKQNK